MLLYDLQALKMDNIVLNIDVLFWAVSVTFLTSNISYSEFTFKICVYLTKGPLLYWEGFQ